MVKKWEKGTVCIQGGYSPGVGEPRILPIAQSTTFLYHDPEQVANLFDLKETGHMYSRISNPTVAAMEEKISRLEGGVGALATSSGQAATLLSILNICSSGQHIIATSTLYGGTHTLLSATLKKMGIDVSFVSPDIAQDELYGLRRPETRAIFAETIGNPSLNVLDFERFAQAAAKIGIPFIVDNTLATPYLCNPLEYGANIVIHSATKYIDGHATSVGGVIVDGGNFDWANGNFPEFTEPDPSYHGIRYYNEFKELAYIVKARVQLLRDMGTSMSPFNAFLFNLGAETLHLRMERHSENALELAKYLKKHPGVSWVNYPKLQDSESYALAEKYLPHGGSGILTFGIKGGREAARAFISKLGLTTLVVHLGDVRTSVLHPASTTHRQLSDEQLSKALVTPDMIRVSVGIEDIGDIIEDFRVALTGFSNIKE